MCGEEKEQNAKHCIFWNIRNEPESVLTSARDDNTRTSPQYRKSEDKAVES